MSATKGKTNVVVDIDHITSVTNGAFAGFVKEELYPNGSGWEPTFFKVEESKKFVTIYAARGHYAEGAGVTYHKEILLFTFDRSEKKYSKTRFSTIFLPDFAPIGISIKEA